MPGGTTTGVVHAGAGLRVRLWVACLLGGLAGAGAVIGLFSWLSPPDPLFDPMALGIWPWSAAWFCLVLAVALGLWLDHGIAFHLRELGRAIASGDPAGLVELPATTGWGELSLLTAQLQGVLARQRDMARAVVELEDLRYRIRALRTAVEMRPAGQTAEPLRPLEGPLGPLVDTLNRRWAEEDKIGSAAREVAIRLRRDLSQALADARDSAEQAERGFVEATSLLTTVRELKRLGGELQQELSTASPGPAAASPSEAGVAEAQRRFREAAAAAIEELIAASGESVERLTKALVQTQGIGEHVQVLANRATLIALTVAVSRSTPRAEAEEPGGAGARPEGLSRDLRSLASEVRAVTDRAAELFGSIDREVAAATARMQGLRERVAAKLDQAPPLPEPDAAGSRGTQPSELALRLLERVREMVQDAAAKGERLSATGERSSRAAERLVRRLDGEAIELERLALGQGANGEELRAESPEPAGETRPGDLRLLGPEDAAAEGGETASDDERRDEGLGDWP